MQGTTESAGLGYVAGTYANLQNYTQWVEYDSKVMLTVEEAVPLIMASLS